MIFPKIKNLLLKLKNAIKCKCKCSCMSDSHDTYNIQEFFDILTKEDFEKKIKE
jgi:hypothetical protein